MLGLRGGCNGTAGVWVGESIEGLPVRRGCWTELEWVELGIEGDILSCDDDIVAVCDEISENLVVATDANEYSLF